MKTLIKCNIVGGLVLPIIRFVTPSKYFELSSKYLLQGKEFKPKRMTEFVSGRDSSWMTE